jgi:hypothetical protein
MIKKMINDFFKSKKISDYINDAPPPEGTNDETLIDNSTKHYYYKRHDKNGKVLEYNDDPHTEDEICALRLYYNDEVRRTDLPEWRKVQDVPKFWQSAVNDIQRK